MQHECIPQAILGMDVICQAKSGMGKTAVFVISTLQQLEPVDGQVRAAPTWQHPAACLLATEHELSSSCSDGTTARPAHF